MKSWHVVLPAMLLAIFVMAGVAFALDAQAAPAASGGGHGIPGMLKGLGMGAVTGLIIAFLGFAKDKDPVKKFDLKAASPTILWGALMGAVFGWESVDLTKWQDFRDTSATVLIAELLGKVGWRNAAPIVGNVTGTLLGKGGGGGNPPAPQA